MKKSFCQLFSVLMIVCLPSAVFAQTTLPKQSDSQPVAVVTLSFKSAPAGVVGYQGTDGDNRFYIQFPTSNKPTVSISNIESAVEVKREKEKSNDQMTVYSIAFQRGTSPRFGLGGTSNEMVLAFTLEDSSSVAIGANPALINSNPGASNASPIPASVTPASPTNGNRTGLQPPSAANQPATTKSVFDEAKEKVNLANLDLSVPESPAFTVLGVTPQTVIRPTSPRQFASSLLNGIDQRGNLQSGVALDFAPYMLYAGDKLTLKQYRESPFLRFLARTQISLATTKGASENDRSALAAVGFHLTLMDKGDPHSDAELMQCFRDNLVLPLPPRIPPPDDPGPNATDVDKLRYELALKKFEDAMAEYQKAKQEASPKNVLAAEECRAKSRKRNWNKSSWIVAFAPAWVSPTGETSDFRYDGGGVWTSIAYGFEGVPGLEKNSQLIFHARYRDNETVPEPEMKDKFFRQDGLFLGGRARVGNENSSVSFEGVFQRLRRVGMSFDNSSRLAFGIERKIAENIWFNVAFGGQTDTPDGKRKGFVLTTFKWGFSQKRTFQTQNE